MGTHNSAIWRRQKQRTCFWNKAGGFTLIELLIVVAIIAILALIAVPNFLDARQRANQARCASNLKAITIALNSYKIDRNKYPPADGIASFDESMGQTAIGNGPAGNGSWDGIPRVLVRLHYLMSDQYLFCPEYIQRFRGPRLQRFRYAYNHSALDTGGTAGGTNNIERDSGDLWIARCLWVPVDHSFTPGAKDVSYPHGNDHNRENVLYSNSRVELRDGAADYLRAYPD
jgi:prepilin-type N-terminal cleavage/methylation domain-containing protein